MMILIMGLILTLAIALMCQVFLSKKTFMKSESLSPLESGFESLFTLVSVSTPFFFLAILFVLFDLELVLFFPGVILLFGSSSSLITWILINFVVIMTLLLEWAFCGLKWQV